MSSPSPHDDAISAAFGIDPYAPQTYHANQPDALAYQGIGGAALLESSARFPSPKPTAWVNAAQRERVLNAADGNLVLWDFDGIIADTEPVQWQSFRHLLARHNFTPTHNFHHTLMGHTEPEIWAMLFEQGAPRHDVDELIATRSDIYIELAKRVLPLSWLAHELMPIFHRSARRQYVISNGNPVNNQALLDHWGYADYVEVVPLGTSTKAEMFAHHTRTSPVPVVLEDSEKYARGAMDSGAFVVGVLHGHSLVEDLSAHVTVRI